MPFKLYKGSSDAIAAELAKTRECIIGAKEIDEIADYAQNVMKLDVRSYDLDKTRKILQGVSLSEIVSRARAAKYEAKENLS
ncbi:hypothetical protein [Nitrososphaera sp.]|uniref:hypothetical protein n=1 Tax=Nitrososphaera sp. TaxID=1971748 RepID=UPI001820BF5A|nr:hypothetical protein [Nitrososphaera sp.]NWG38248.1 hypothetical protein [Nitrososphaera sp.]